MGVVPWVRLLILCMSDRRCGLLRMACWVGSLGFRSQFECGYLCLDRRDRGGC